MAEFAVHYGLEWPGRLCTTNYYYYLVFTLRLALQHLYAMFIFPSFFWGVFF